MAETHEHRDRVAADRVLLASSLLLVVLTVAFTLFMDAEKTWQSHEIDINIRLETDGLSDSARANLIERRDYFHSQAHEQRSNAQHFAWFMALVMLVTAMCIPAGIWKSWISLDRVVMPVFAGIVLALALATAAFASGIWNP